MSQGREGSKSDSVVELTPEVLASLDPTLQKALLEVLDKQKLERQEKETALLKEDMYTAAMSLLEVGCMHVIDVEGHGTNIFRPHELNLDEDPLPTGESYCDLTLFYLDLYGWDFIGPSVGVSLSEGIPYPIIAYHPLRKHPLVRYDFYHLLMEAAREEETFIYFGTFYTPESGFLTVKKPMMRTLNGFAVDIDRRVFDDGRMANMGYYIEVLRNRLLSIPEGLQPDYVLLSGTAAQLWYTFEKPIVLQSKKSPRRDKYNKLYEKLYAFFSEMLPSNACKVDVGCATINHAFRAPYTRSKYGFQTALYKWPKKKKTSALELSEYLGGGLTELDVVPIDKTTYEAIKAARPSSQTVEKFATDKQLGFIDNLHAMKVLSDDDVSNAVNFTLAQADELIKKGLVKLERYKELKESGGIIHTSAGRAVQHKPRHRKLYEFTLRQIKEKTTPGSRYNALFVLACTAWNCSVSRSQLEFDMRELQKSEWGRKGGHDGKPITDSDIKSAMLGYTDLAALRKRSHNESMLEWSYGPHQTRNNQTRWTHLHGDVWVVDGQRKQNDCKAHREFRLKEMRENGEIPGRPKGSIKEQTAKGEMIKAYAAEHPETSNRQIAEALGVSRNTVNKWLKRESGR